MKKLITNLFLGLAIMASFQVSAQYCGSSTVSFPACGAVGGYGFGDVNTFACITRGQCDSLIIPFTVYNTFSAQGNTINIVKLQFNSIDSLPCGLCWSTSVSQDPNNQPNEFNATEPGCLKISGLTNDPAGSYLLYLTLNVATPATCLPNDTTFAYQGIPSNAGGVFIWVKVIDPGAQCPTSVDSTHPAHPSTSCTHLSCPLTGINEISKTLSALNVQPNPMSNEAKVSFASETAGVQQITITDVVGREVYNANYNAKVGMNETTISRNKMPAGIYILYVGSNQGTATKKFVIED